MNGLLKHKNKSTLPLSASGLSPLTRLHEEIDHAMQDFYNLFESTSSKLGVFENIKLSPPLDIIEEKDCLRLEAEMPGMNEKEIRITANENLLTIEGQKTVTKKVSKENFLSR